MDFDLDPPPPARPTLDSTLGERVSSDPPPREFEFKLDLDGLDLPTPADATKAAPVAKDAHWYDVQQKFDLAKAYQEMGDRDGARDILREVLKEGDQDQRTQATQLIAKLG
jgi:pilus assembly protein FimV